MDTITIILIALATNKIFMNTDEIIDDLYKDLKRFMQDRFSDKPEAKLMLEKYEEDAQIWKEPLKKILIETNIGEDEEIINKAKKLLTMLPDFFWKLPYIKKLAKQPVSKTFNLNNIKILLTEGFTDKELRRLCYYESHFRPVHEKLATEMGKDRIIDKLIEYAERKGLIGYLLAWAKEHNVVQYESYKPYYKTADSMVSSGHEKPDKDLLTSTDSQATGQGKYNIQVTGNIQGFVQGDYAKVDIKIESNDKN